MAAQEKDPPVRRAQLSPANGDGQFRSLQRKRMVAGYYRCMKSRKAFLSHASEDKDRFVREFAKKLYAKGVEVWVDGWEIYPGDSLVDKIFEEGLKGADAIIIVLSTTSVTKAWVREELNASVVKHIEKGTRIIPVVLDNVEVPESLKNTVWVKIGDLANYDAEVDRVVSAIYDIRPKPHLGKPPAYAAAVTPTLPGLANQDAAVLRLFGDAAVRDGSMLGIDTEQVWDEAETQGLSREDYLDSLEILSKRGYLKRSRVLGDPPPDFSVTTHGFDTYLHNFTPNFKSVFRRIAFAIINEGKRLNADIVDATGHEKVIVDHVLEVMADKRYVELNTGIGGYMEVTKVFADLRRLLQNPGA